MKKLVVLLLVLGMVSVANAHLIFTVNGEPQGPEVTISLGQSIELDLELSGDEDILKYSLEYALNNEQAEFVTDSILFPWQSMFPGKIATKDEVGICQWVRIAADNFMADVAGPLDLMNGLYVHCLEETDVILTVTVYGDTVIDGETIEVGTEMHALTIHQIPEPATIALLGLGGLFLRRRKK